MSEDKKLEILYQHYCAMVERNKSDVRARYRYLLFTIAVLTFNILQMLYADDANALVMGLLNRLVNVDESRDFPSIDFIIVLALMLLVIRYFQIVITVERQYPHTSFLEEQLSKQFDDNVFTFEGEGYLRNYPKLLDISHMIYTVIVPLILFVVSLWRICIQFPLTVNIVQSVTIIVFSGVIIVFVIFYWMFMYPKVFSKVPLIKRLVQNEPAQQKA